MSISVAILAAGAGTRMKSSLPKVLHKICGKEMLFYSIDEALKISDDIHIVLFHQHEKIKEAIQKSFGDSKITFHIQNHLSYPGTGGALMNGADQNPISTKYDKVLVLNGDMPLVKEKELLKLISPASAVSMSVLTLENPTGYGRVIIEDKKVTSIVEEKDAQEATKSICIVNAGVYVFERHILETYLPKLNNHNNQKEYYLTDIIGLCAKDNKEVMPVFVNEKDFMGVNSKSQLAYAESIMLQDLRNKAMDQGVIMHLPETIYLESEVVFEGECEIENGVCIKGKSKIINSHIKAHTVIENSCIKDSDIGPMAHIRPGCQISNTHIGNFVELKASILNGVKAGHLSYLGDCSIDEGSNIGAGVITCNYDGKKKHKTIIGKNVFVGSDTQLIAPINIASNVLIGSGTTMTKDAKEGDLITSRVKQENKAGGFYRFFGYSKESSQSND
ncbi:bifunctional UDP-N-acetylglucosamine diphosphorylase/glucosamine-1-phosphate N-acetyltransferase GlmU [Helicobacter cappadocius]|uniref:Bifunctional protein GlmU n=1 Tax=Helicobacter cappadocius TaxID=3063998 RepID=A0AA90T9Y0_9HELI|nr:MULTISPECIES: bifunctional UDP-N-acetylglucosamine diphosphorylase/glucosamine-1-phosphate N-acetyltransferase GlmU [unclassified Helicobacter]MDO7253389.1 bifunctional UDP-N-acetylglucosamine diphosphorylase/glucosamine-1-phosphate N-acetyltransferase GlmU [Helicobacter sp. faydin-H75]MDP2539347.1 bifunctional UDP-N-acetylglucosamine diphosphorylase/glucosamine-1-phosphate N-acetyltransferase GlmU [Helicobacter sp. faydin-H76]